MIAVSRKGAEEILRAFEGKYEVKSQMLGEDADLAKEGAVLNRRIQWVKGGIRMEADPRHAQEVVRALGMEKSNPVGTPMATDGSDNAESEEARGLLLEGEEATRYRAVAARLNYLAQDRADLAVPTLKVCSRMANPTEKYFTALKRIAKYLLHRPKAAYLYQWQDPGAMRTISSAPVERLLKQCARFSRPPAERLLKQGARLSKEGARSSRAPVDRLLTQGARFSRAPVERF